MKQIYLKRTLFSLLVTCSIVTGYSCATSTSANRPTKNTAGLPKDTLPRVSTKVWFLFNNDAPVSVDIRYQDGTQGEITIQPNGSLEADAHKGDYLTLTSETPGGDVVVKRIYLHFDDIRTPVGCWQRLVNLDYPDHNRVIAHGFEADDFPRLVANFQVQIGLEMTGECDPTTQSVLEAVMRSTASRYELMENSADLLPIPMRPKIVVPSIREIIEANKRMATPDSVNVLDSSIHLPTFMRDAEEISHDTKIHPYISKFFGPVLPMKRGIVFLDALHEEGDAPRSFKLSIFETTNPFDESGYTRLFQFDGYTEKDGDTYYFRLISDGVVFYWVAYGNIFVELVYGNGSEDVVGANDEESETSIKTDPVLPCFKEWIKDNVSQLCCK